MLMLAHVRLPPKSPPQTVRPLDFCGPLLLTSESGH
jgi:hypothetical protein